MIPDSHQLSAGIQTTQKTFRNQISVLANLGFGGLQFKTQSIERELFVNRKRKLDNAHFDKIRFWAKIRSSISSIPNQNGGRK